MYVLIVFHVSNSLLLEAVYFAFQDGSLFVFPSRKIVCDIVIHSLAVDISDCKYYYI